MSLYEPLSFRSGAVAPNRVFLAAMTNGQSLPDGRLGDDELHWLARRADGGFGVITTCAAHVAQDGKAWAGELGVHDDAMAPGLARLAARVQTGGALGLVQLFHGGVRAAQAVSGVQPWSASVWHEDAPTFETPRAATEADLRRVIDQFAAAARRSHAAGFTGVELHGAHGYLLCQFLSRTMNPRTDGWGDTLEGRARLIREVARAVRAAVPAPPRVTDPNGAAASAAPPRVTDPNGAAASAAPPRVTDPNGAAASAAPPRVTDPNGAAASAAPFVVGVRLSPEDWGQARGLDLDESVQVARWLADDGVDFVHLSLWRALENTKKRPSEHAVTIFRAALPADVRIVAAGGLWTRADADAILARGADAVALARAAICNPDWPKEAARAGWEPRRPPMTPAELRERALSPAFVEYMRRWKDFVSDSRA